MIKLFSIEFWTVVQLLIHFLLVLVVWALVRKLHKIQSDTTMHKKNFEVMSASIYQDTLDMLEKSTDALADKAAVQMVDRAAQDIIDLLEPLVKGSEATAHAFDSQIREKKRLIRELNDTLDSRIISINLLLSRAEVLLNNQESNGNFSGFRSQGGGKNIDFSGTNTMSDYKDQDLAHRQSSQQARQFEQAGEDVFDQQQKIVELYQKGMDAETISSKLSMPRGEVQLVINLKEKFIKMEKQF